MDLALELAGRLLPSIALVVGALYGLRRMRRSSEPAGDHLRVTGRSGVTRGALVAVVEADGRRFLVGAGEQGVQLLTELDPREDPTEDPVDPDGLQVHTDAAPLQDVPSIDRPWSGLVHRLQHATVRTHVEAPLREPDR